MRDDFGSDTIAVLSALRDLQWMARRAVSMTTTDPEGRDSVDAATYLLERLLHDCRMEPCRPDRTANRAHGGDLPTAIESIWVDGNGPYEPPAEVVAAWAVMSFASKVQWVADRLHPRAHWYADGRATYATGMFNAATDRLARARVDLSITEGERGRVWVEDAMGPGFASRGSALPA